jgi:phosphoglycerate dehydrogenase-like enzyme
MRKVLFIGPEPQCRVVRENLTEYEVIYSIDDTEIVKRIAEFDVILDAYMKIQFPKERLEKAINLKVLVTATTGANHIDEAYLESKGIPVFTLKGQEQITKNVTAAAELSFTLLLAVARQLKAAVRETENGEWERNKFPGYMLRNRSIGIIGCGRIGGWMACYAEAFGMKVYGYDPYIEELPPPFEAKSLEELLEISDFISIHIPLNDSTKGFICRNSFERMKEGAVLVNTSRGEIIDEVALLDALESGKLWGAGLDVLAGEPKINDHPLIRYSRNHDNLIITPHIGGFSPDALEMLLKFSCERIKKHFSE